MDISNQIWSKHNLVPLGYKQPNLVHASLPPALSHSFRQIQGQGAVRRSAFTADDGEVCVWAAHVHVCPCARPTCASQRASVLACLSKVSVFLQRIIESNSEVLGT
jgi:hypothetical protein